MARPQDHDEEQVQEPRDIDAPADEPSALSIESTMDVDMISFGLEFTARSRQPLRSPVDHGDRKPLTIASGAACRRSNSKSLREKNAALAATLILLEPPREKFETASVAYARGPCVVSIQYVGDREAEK